MSSISSSFSYLPLEIKRVIWGFAHQHDCKFSSIMRLVCKVWEKAHYEYVPMKELVRRREHLPAAFPNYKLHIELFLSEKFYPLYVICNLKEDIDKLREMRKEILYPNAASSTSACKTLSIGEIYMLESDKEERLKKIKKNIKTADQSKVYPNFYKDDQTKMFISLSDNGNFYFFDNSWVFISALRFKLRMNLQEILKEIENIHGVKATICKALMASLGYSIPFAHLEDDNGYSDSRKIDEMFVYLSYIKGSKFQDVVTFGENKKRMDRRSFINAFVSRLLAEMSADPYESLEKFGEYNLNEKCRKEIFSLDLDEYFRTTPLTREDYKTILVAFFTFIDLDSSYLFLDNQLFIQDKEFVDECVEEYRKIKKGPIPSQMNVPATEMSIEEFVYETIKRLAYLILSGIFHLLVFIERNSRRPSLMRNCVRM